MRINTLNALRAILFTGVIAYAIYTVDHVFSLHMDVELASIQEGTTYAGTLAGCATDTECEMAEAAAVEAVATERQLASYGGGGRELAKAGKLGK